MGVELLILVDNTADDESLRAEHGLAVLVSGLGAMYLFDTGATADVLMDNCRGLGVDLSAVDGFIISHGHYDHTGGLAEIVRGRQETPLYAHPRAFSRRWADKPGRPLKDVSCPFSLDALCEGGAVLHAVRAPEMLEEWALVSGPIGGPMPKGESFVVRKDGEMVADTFEDEICLLLRGTDGWVVLTGCCHRGLENTLRAARFLTHNEPVRAVVGGLHLRNASEERLERTAKLLESHGSPEVYCGHCTGERATEFLQQRLGGKVRPFQVGKRISL
jgi:7,8-dihydropterin-6-yl-methyl-4-(beta-D-ribofuranosyl)aminobenzene 5'-phosphate synthase